MENGFLCSGEVIRTDGGSDHFNSLTSSYLCCGMREETENPHNNPQARHEMYDRLASYSTVAK